MPSTSLLTPRKLAIVESVQQRSPGVHPPDTLPDKFLATPTKSPTLVAGQDFGVFDTGLGASQSSLPSSQVSDDYQLPFEKDVLPPPQEDM